MNFADAYKRYSYLEIVKVELVCADKDLERFVDIIQRQCHTGEKGDGVVFVSEVCGAIRIRDGARGEACLSANVASQIYGKGGKHESANKIGPLVRD